MPRASMAGLIARLRGMVDDTVASRQRWTDDQLQTYLDTNRVRLSLSPLVSDYLRIEWLSDFPNLETNTVVYDGSANVVSTGFTANFDAGTFTFDAQPNYTPRISGYAYDLHGAAADCWTELSGVRELWKSKFSALQLQEQIKMHKALSWPRSADAFRADRPPEAGWYWYEFDRIR